jgi:Protein of unknown function (DUF3151)
MGLEWPTTLSVRGSGYDLPMSHLPVNEPWETTIQEPSGSIESLEGGDAATVAARFPECLTAWATLGESALAAGREIEAYAYFRVGYHRGLDRIRKAGWRGSGLVPWKEESNRGFLRSLRGLAAAADAIGERDEAERCTAFLREIAPDAPAV